MNIQRKLELVEQHVKLISRAEDTDSGVREAALKRIEAFVESERAEMSERVQAHIEANVAVKP